MTDYVVLDVKTTPSESNNPLRDGYDERLSELKKWIDRRENLDVYQYAAIRSATNTLSNIDLYKVAAVFLLQEWSIWYVLFEDFSSMQICNRVGDYHLKHLSAVFSIVISLTFYNALINLRLRGLYSWGTNQPRFVKKKWLSLGFIVNIGT